MVKYILLIGLLLFLSLSQCAKPKSTIDNKMVDMMTTEATTTTTSAPVEETKDMKEEIDLFGVLNQCNETFRVEMSYLEALNTTGSFPDETDKNPKCYIRCVLENLEVISDKGEFDTDQAAVIYAALRNIENVDNVDDMVNMCAERRESCKCEKSYNFLKCLFSMDIEKKSNA